MAMLGDIVTTISGGGIYSCIETITQDFPYNYRVMGTPSHELFLQRYGGWFHDQLGLASQVVHFEKGQAVSPQNPVKGGDNLIAVLPGKSLTKWVVIGGHYDTRELTVGGGALDNTSGLCTVFELAKAYTTVFARHGVVPEATVVFAWWDGEEWGLYGSKAFVEDHNATKHLLGLEDGTPVDLVAAVSFDMVGLNYPAYNTWIQYGDPATLLETAVLNVRTSPVDWDNYTCGSACYKVDDYSEAVQENFTNYRALVEEVAYRFLGFPAEYVWVYDDSYGRSDHVPFIASGVPGMRVQGSHDSEYPHYHQPTDTLAALIPLAGDETKLRAGFDKAADVGGVTFAYAAARGRVGPIGFEDEVPSSPAASPESAQATPGPGVSLAFVLVMAPILFRGRRE